MPRLLFSLFAAVGLGLVAAGPAEAGPLEASGVERVSFHERSDGQGYVVRIHTSDRVRAYRLEQNGGTVDVVVFRAELAPGARFDRAEGPVREYDVEAGRGRVTLHMKVDASVEVQAYPDRDSDDLLVSLSTARRPSPLSARAPAVRPSPRATAPPAVVAPTVAAPLPSEAGANWRLDTIVLDAGHGGHEPGGVGLYGVTDAKVALAVVKRLGPRIERELGVRVVYTRDADRWVELEDRGPIANRARAKLFVSVHGNVGPSSASGTETFFLAPRGSKSARAVMLRENEIVRSESDPDLYEEFDEETDILTALAMSAYQEESQFLAGLVEREFVRQGRKSRGVKQNNFQVLREASMPGILVEVGFVSNPDEARYLKSERGLDEVADALFEAIRAYRDHYESGFRLGNGS